MSRCEGTTVFRDVNLGDVLTFQRGFDITKAEQSEGSIPIFSSSGVSSYHNKWRATGPGVIIGRKGTLGTVHFAEDKYWPHDTTLWVKDFKGNCPRFIYYFLQILHLERFDTGASNPTLNRNHLHKIKILFPCDLDVQKKIAAILSAYDDLIENNRRRIALLEKMAEELYREWFVRLRFPGHEQTRIVKGVPEGWETARANSFFDVVKGLSYKGNEVKDEPQGVPFVTLKSFKRGGGYREEGLKFYSGNYLEAQMVRANDIVMAVTDMTQDRAVVGRVARVPDLGDGGAVISLDVVKLAPKNINGSFLYSYMRHSGFGDFIKEFANGTNVLHLKPDLISRQKIVVPLDALQKSFATVIEPIYRQQDVLSTACYELSKSRDMLLSRLISGKLSVEDLDIQFPPSMRDDAFAQTDSPDGSSKNNKKAAQA